MSAPAQSVLPAALLAELYAGSGAGAWDMTLADFTALLEALVAKFASSGVGSAEAETFCRALKLEELALARACAAGHERAWETFLTRYRAKLYDMALGIAREQSAARDLADSLFADLYGTTLREGRRVSKLASYTGRGSLEGWLRTVLAQEFVNRYRRQRHTVSLEEKVEAGVQFAARVSEPVPVADSRLQQATAEVLSALDAEDRFLLASYHLDGRTLAEIARTLGVHESTISRRLEKLTRSLRKHLLTALSRRGMDRRQAEEALTVDVRDFHLDVRTQLTQENDPTAFSKQGLRARAGDARD
jgi:RNA polymerase sigma-70 factor (ECF subfamily)